MPVKKILIIDDSPTERFFVVDLLTKKGYQTFIAESGEEGIAKAKAEKPDVGRRDAGAQWLPGDTHPEQG